VLARIGGPNLRKPLNLSTQKEPKLERARKIPEWEQYDSEIAHFTRRLAEEGCIHTSAAAADVNELAKAGSGGPVRTPPETEDAHTTEAESLDAIHDEL
jgi:UDP-glucose:glycoprotein glucosyltransferase